MGERFAAAEAHGAEISLYTEHDTAALHIIADRAASEDAAWRLVRVPYYNCVIVREFYSPPQLGFEDGPCHQ